MPLSTVSLTSHLRCTSDGGIRAAGGCPQETMELSAPACERFERSVFSWSTTMRAPAHLLLSRIFPPTGLLFWG
jgi:hypothetical protein